MRSFHFLISIIHHIFLSRVGAAARAHPFVSAPPEIGRALAPERNTRDRPHESGSNRMAKLYYFCGREAPRPEAMSNLPHLPLSVFNF